MVLRVRSEVAVKRFTEHHQSEELLEPLSLLE